jgi:hypothetical protein
MFTIPTEKSDRIFKKKPDYKIFTKDEKGKLIPVGVAYNHRKGGGFNIDINKIRLVAFPVHELTEEEGA